MIRVYTNPNCVQCDQTKKWLEKNGLEYKAIDLSQDKIALDMVLGLGYMSAPVVMVNESVHWSGFRLDKLTGIKK